MSAPGLRLLDAAAEGLDEGGLRRLAREQSERAGAAYVARSYRFPYALIAWHEQPVGVDIERIEPLESSFADAICTPSELLELPRWPDSEQLLTSLWCAKEALAKALGDALRYDPRRLEAPLHWPEGKSGPWRAKQLAVPSGHVGWLCWRSAER